MKKKNLWISIIAMVAIICSSFWGGMKFGDVWDGDNDEVNATRLSSRLETCYIATPLAESTEIIPANSDAYEYARSTFTSAEQSLYDDMKESIAACSGVDFILNDSGFYCAGEAAVDTSQTELTRDDAINVLWGLSVDHPEFFWVDEVWYCEDGDDLVLYFASEDEFAEAATRRTIYESLEQASEEYCSEMDGMTSYEKICYLVEKLDARLTYSASNGVPVVTPYTATVASYYSREAVCSGYAKTFDFMASKAGLACVYVTGVYDNANYHAWNHVYLEDGDDSGWYLLDLTSIDSGVDAFLLGTEDMDRYAPITRTGYCAAAGGDVFGCELPQLEAASYKGNESNTDQTVEDTATEPEEITGDVSNEEVKTEENTTDGAVNSNAGSTSTSDKTESSTKVFTETEITIESNESDSSTTKTSESTVISETGNGFSAEQGSVSTQHSEDTASQSTASSEQSANTESTLSGWDLVYQLENLAHEETEKGNYLAAISYYEQVIAIEPSEAMALYYNIGWNYHYAGYYAKGCENYIKAMKLGDTNVAWSMCYNCVMEGYSSLTQDQLYKIFSEMVQIQEQSDLYDRLSRIAYEYYGDIDSAILYMNKAIELADSGSEDEQCYLIYLYQLERKKADPNYVFYSEGTIDVSE